jgi:hypothetical protein
VHRGNKNLFRFKPEPDPIFAFNPLLSDFICGKKAFGLTQRIYLHQKSFDFSQRSLCPLWLISF